MAIVPNMLAVCTTTAGPLQFRNSTADVALSFPNLNGSTFDFSGIRPPYVPFIAAMMQRNMGTGVAVGDYDRDGDLDVYFLGQLGVTNALFRNEFGNGGSGFTNISSVAVADDVGFSRTAYFADLDNDGWDDLLVINDDVSSGAYPACRVFRNERGNFVDVTVGSGFAPVGLLKGGLCLGDYDLDGFLDVYVTVWRQYQFDGPGAFEGQNRLFRNLGSFQFEDATQTAGLGVLARDSFSCVFADFDNDGDSDLYVAVDHTEDVYYRNDNGHFVDDTIAVGATHTGNDMGIAVADFDFDGDLDVFSTNITDYAGRFGTLLHNTLLINQSADTGTIAFVDEAVSHNVEDVGWGWGCEFFDADNDGVLDLFAANGFDEFVQTFGGANHPLLTYPAVLFSGNEGGDFSTTTGSGADVISDARAAIAFDYDQDGDQDVLITNVNEPAILLENTTPSGGHWIDVNLVGGCGVNANAIGARVYVSAGGRTQMQEIIAGGSYLSGRPHVAHFGVGSASVVAGIRVLWPDGRVQLLASLTPERRVTIHRLWSDHDLSGTVDLRDVAAFQRCFARQTDAECTAFDQTLSGSIGTDLMNALSSAVLGPASHCTGLP